MNMEEKSCYVPIEEVLQHPKSLEHSMEESLRCKSQTSKSCYPLREILSHDSNSITTSCEANSIHESHLTDETSMTLKMEDKLNYMPIEEVIQPSKSFENSMEENPLYESHSIACTSMKENKISQSTQTENILPNRICSKEKMIIAMISIMFIMLVVCIGVMFNSILIKSQHNNSSLQNQTNIKYNDDHFIIQAISRMSNTSCRFNIPRDVVRIFNISSWALNEDNDPRCSGYNMKEWDGRPRHQFIDLGSRRCGSICDNTSRTINNTIHSKVKYDEFNERSISVPISCKYISFPKTEKFNPKIYGNGWCL